MTKTTVRRALLLGPALVAAAILLGLGGTVSCQNESDSCDRLDCAGGICRVWADGNTAYCVCFPGSHPSPYGNGCEPNSTADPCAGVACSGHGECQAAGSFPFCECDSGYLPDESALNCLPRSTGADADADADADGGGPVDYPVRTPGGLKLDMAVLIDNSGSMSQEQAALTARFPDLLAALLDPADDDGDTWPDHPPVTDLNIGILSTDMGTAGYRVSTCSNSEVGDNGCFRSAPSPAVSGCEATYPAFLSRNPTNEATYNAADMAHDFTCLATLGTQGCGFEQQLKAMRQALTVNPATGTCNRGFLRLDSLLALLFITDEEDCSVRPDHNEMFDPTRDDLGHLNIRCFRHPEFVEDVAAYADAFRGLRPDRPDLLVLGMIVGVPPDAPACIGTGDSLGDCLGVPAMTAQIDPTDPTSLIPSCNTSMGQAFPPRRFVTLAQAFGEQAYVDSICKTDWTNALRGIADRLQAASSSACLPPGLDFDPLTCALGCWLLETLPDARMCDDDPSCPAAECPLASVDDLPDLAPCRESAGGPECVPLKRDLGLNGTGQRLCLVRQASRAPDLDGCSAPFESGWTFEPGSSSCARVAPTDGTIFGPDSGVTLRCGL
ncbi:MAG: hypothetical protein HY905_16030 [Deltaproteobacteria bacterium]|nr:hypothetical protein [Deltaproteobacteria bacterium]